MADELVSAFPPPPFYIFTDEFNESLEPPPTLKEYRMFGKVYSNERLLPSLEEQDVASLYVKEDVEKDRVSVLKRLLGSLLATYLSLLDTLVSQPDQYAPQVESIRILLLNMHHLLNEYRSEQAKETISLMLQQQFLRRQSILETVESTLQVLEKEIEQVKSTLFTMNPEENLVTFEPMAIDEPVVESNAPISSLDENDWLRKDAIYAKFCVVAHQRVLYVFETVPEPSTQGSDRRLVQLLDELSMSYNVHLWPRSGSSKNITINNWKILQVEPEPWKQEKYSQHDTDSIHFSNISNDESYCNHFCRILSHYDSIIFALWFWQWPMRPTSIHAFMHCLQKKCNNYYRPRIIIHTDDVHGWRERAIAKGIREQSFDLNPIASSMFKRARVISKLEREALRFADEIWLATENDAVLLKSRQINSCNITVYPFNISNHIIPLIGPFQVIQQKRVILVTGTHLINMLSLHWFLENVWPHVLARNSDASLHVIGRTWGGHDNAFLFHHFQLRPVLFKQVHWHGSVTELELTTWLTKCARFMVAPVLTGTGIAVKTFEALRHNVALVTTSFGAAGISDSNSWIMNNDSGAWESVESRQFMIITQSAQEMIDALNLLLSSDQKIANMKYALRERIK